MEEWLKEHGISSAIIAVLLLCWKGKTAVIVIRDFFSAAKKVHESDGRLIEGYERERERDKRAKEDALRGAARQQTRILSLVEKLELKEDINTRDRIARIIYLKYLRECRCDMKMIEQEIKEEVERRVISDALNSNG